MSPPGPFVLCGTRYVVLAGTEEGFTLSQLDQQRDQYGRRHTSGRIHQPVRRAPGDALCRIRPNDGSAR